MRVVELSPRVLACLAVVSVSGCAAPAAVAGRAIEPAAAELSTDPVPAVTNVLATEPLAPAPAIQWRFEARADVVEHDCPDDVSVEDLPQCEPSARVKVVAIAPSGSEKVVFEDIIDGEYFDTTHALLTAVADSADPNISVLRMVGETGADFYTASTHTYLVRLDPAAPGLAILFTATGEMRAEMDSCVATNRVDFHTEDEGRSIVAVREQETTFTPQHGVEVECEPKGLKQVVLKKIAVDDRPARRATTPKDAL